MRWKRIAIGAVAGGFLGWLYWHEVGCINGCAIWSSWWKSTGYGMLMGGLILDAIKFNNA